MSLIDQPAAFAHAVSVPQRPCFVVGQDPQGRWVAVESHGLAGGIFRSCEDAIHYAVGETRRRPDAVRLASDRIEFRM